VLTTPRSRSFLPLLAGSLVILLVGQVATRNPKLLVPLFALGLAVAVSGWLARRRMRRLLRSGDVEAVLGRWEESVGKVSYAETLTPLMAATAYAAYGWVDAARRALSRAAKGPAWDAAVEQRLFIETLLDTFEGERSSAMEKAEALSRMPLPRTGWLTRRKVRSLRGGMGALARAFAHESRAGDVQALRAAARASPLVHWAMRYAAAVVAIDEGRRTDVPALLEDAPTWPEASAYRAYQSELFAQVVRPT
jgi:hypothetical protein